MTIYHKTVFAQEAIEHLKIKKNHWYIDCTLGDGGHTLEILKNEGNVLGLDQDEEAIRRTLKRIEEVQDEAKSKYVFKFDKKNFKDIDEAVRVSRVEDISGIIYDLGTSFNQLNDPLKGFSFKSEEMLDMRMDTVNMGVTAKDLVNGLSEKELERLIFTYGEDRFGKRIARAIVTARKGKVIQSGKDLAQIIEQSVPRLPGAKIHAATRTFQALRIAVNNELENLENSLAKSVEILTSGGRLVVISFHSLEDKIVKELNKRSDLTEVFNKPLIPSDEEISSNPRSRSAKLRAFEKL